MATRIRYSTVPFEERKNTNISSDDGKKNNILSVVNPELAKEWHPTKNGSLTPDMVTAGSNKKVWWQCKQGHEWQATINNRNKGKNCPYCAGNKRYTTQSFKEKLYTSNPSITLCGEYVNGKTKSLFKCEVCGYQWSAFPGNVLRGVSGCPRCSKKERYTTQSFKEKMNIVNPNIEILGEYENSTTKIECECMLCGYRWKATSASLLRGRGCHRCAKQERYTTETFKDKVAKINPNITILGEYINNKTHIQCKCNLCGLLWESVPSVLLQGGGCPGCCHVGTSFAEQFIAESLKSVLGNENVLTRNRTAFGKELDIYIPSCHFAIEFNGWVWHKNKLRQDNEKARVCKEKGIELLLIYDACPINSLPVNGNYITFPRDIGSEPDKKSLKRVVQDIFILLGLNASTAQKINSIDWDEISRRAYINSRKKTTERFKKELYKINPNIEVLGEYTKTHKKIQCRCKKCGHQWSASPANLLRKRGCPDCSKKMYTKESFEKELAKHNPNIRIIGEFTYANQKTLCQCTVCGHKWRPRLSGLLGYRGCPHCSKREKYTTETFIEKARSINPDISILGEYINGSNRILCKCNTCGNEWNPIASNILLGYGCPVCANEKKRIKIRGKYNTETFKKGLFDINPDITVVGEYVGNNKKTACLCNICGYKWEPFPSTLLRGGHCPSCSKKVHYNTDTFKENLLQVNPNITVLGKYVNGHTNLLCKCNVCGEKWKPRPDGLLCGHGCPTCAKQKRMKPKSQTQEQ